MTEISHGTGTGILIFDTTPVCAKVYVNNKFYGATKLPSLQIINVNPGKYSYSLQLKGFKSYENNIYVQADKITHIHFNFNTNIKNEEYINIGTPVTDFSKPPTQPSEPTQPTQPPDNDEPSLRQRYYDEMRTSVSTEYTNENIFDFLSQNAENITVINDGPGSIYIKYSNDGTHYSNEFIIHESEAKKYIDVHTLKVRTSAIGITYRITEFEIWTSTSVMKGTDGTNLQTVALDSAGNIIGVMKGAYSGSLVTIAVDSAGLMQADISKAEKIEIYSTVSTTHFTESIAMNAQETENLTGLTANMYMVRGVNIQSVQPLKYRLILWGTDGFNNTDLDTDSYIDDVILDMTKSSAFRIDNANQYRLNSGDLEILYEDYDITKKLHISLQNLSATAKIAGTSGAVQLDIKMSPRL